jgi:hypothetical protein
MALGVWRPTLVAAILLGTVQGSAEAVHPWSPVRNTAPQRATSRVDESRPISYPRLAHVDPADRSTPADRLLRELLDLHTAMSYQEAAEVADRLVLMMPHRPQAHYNRACVMGRLRRGDEALSSLELAVSCGWRDLVHLSVDPDLDSIRDTARYAEITQRLRHLVASEVQAPAAQPGLADDIHREAPAILRDLGVPSATIALVNDGRVSWMTSITTGRAEPEAPGRDEPIEVSSVVRLFALVALLNQPPPEAGAMTDAGPGRGAVLRQAGHQLKDPRAASESELIEAVESATSRPFAPYCRTHILGPLRMDRTRFAEPPDTSAPVVYSTAGDLGRLVAALCPPAGPAAAHLPAHALFDRQVALGERFGLQTTGDRGSAAAALELAHRSEGGAALLRWYPQRGRGLVIVTRGGDGILAARRIVGLAFAGR